jgi:hypothetical protein
MTSTKNANLKRYLEELTNRMKSKETPKQWVTDKQYRDYLNLEIQRTQLRLETDPVVEPKSK